MKTGRAIASGVLIWVLVFTLFGLLDFIPVTHGSGLLQAVMACTLVIPIALLAAIIYYNSGDKSSGLAVGVVMVATALLLDALITVPFFEMPLHGRNHTQFFTDPLLWIIVAEDLLVIWIYQRLKVMKSHR